MLRYILQTMGQERSSVRRLLEGRMFQEQFS